MYIERGVHGNMPHFAKISDSNVVEKVEVFSQEDIDANGGDYSSSAEAWVSSYKGGGTWKQTSYNTYGGEHKLGGTPFRKNYAGIGFTYDQARDAFIEPKPFDSWTLNETTCMWDPPVPRPESGSYSWNETTKQWDLDE